MNNKSRCLQNIEQLCDILEMNLGREEGSKKCRELLEEIKKCPTCCAEIDTITKTIRVFQQIPEKEIPEDVQWRLKSILNLDVGNASQPGETNSER